MDSDFSSSVNSYWVGKATEPTYTCPNVSLFRLIGALTGDIKDKLVLEVGFAHGADLKECKRRGAEIFGLDLNPIYVEALKSEEKCDVRVFRAGVDTIPFDFAFDLIYSRDTIYYLNDNEIEQFFSQCARKIKNDGTIIVQFIETDLVSCSNSNIGSHNFDMNFMNQYRPSRMYIESNPIRFLISDEVIKKAEAANLKLFASKRMIQSYDLNESTYRVDKYLVFKQA